MIRLIAAISIILMPIISVSTSQNEREIFVRSNDLCDEHCPEKPSGPPPPFAGDAFADGITMSRGN